MESLNKVMSSLMRSLFPSNSSFQSIGGGDDDAVAMLPAKNSFEVELRARSLQKQVSSCTRVDCCLRPHRTIPCLAVLFRHYFQLYSDNVAVGRGLQSSPGCRRRLARVRLRPRVACLYFFASAAFLLGDRIFFHSFLLDNTVPDPVSASVPLVTPFNVFDLHDR
jgi:hypothetical protein